MSRQATAWRRRVVDAFYHAESRAVTVSEREHWHFCRELLRRALEGWRDPWVAAHYYTYGLHPTEYRKRLADLHARCIWELHQARPAPSTAYRSKRPAA